MAKHDPQPQELSTARGNFLTVLVNLATGQSRVLDAGTMKLSDLKH